MAANRRITWRDCHGLQCDGRRGDGPVLAEIFPIYSRDLPVASPIGYRWIVFVGHEGHARTGMAESPTQAMEQAEMMLSVTPRLKPGA